ncbi:DoxX family protein [Pseudoalteromonas sp. M8]|uniref:DoxX family protein n=1 Tax=Pseudoalteromonas sp. M8 TaxID=2692624 RepID=UPI002010E0E8|nr:DoxX family protein [Pseudoalteromonas sp. M8]
MASSGLLSELLPLVIAFELIGGLFILAGAFTQLTAIAFAGFSIVSALLFHFDLADQIQFLMFFKNIAVAGGFLALAASGAGKFSIDSKLVESK